MSLLSVAPDIVSEASSKLENLGSALRSASAVAASQTTAVAAPAEDEVSVAITALLGTHAQEFQTINAQAAAFHDEFVSNLSSGAAQYVGAELINAQQTLTTVNAPAGAAASTPLVNVSQDFGPFGVSLNTTIDSLSAGGLLGTTNASVALNTPFGAVPLLSAGGTSAITSDGRFSMTLGQSLPFLSYGASLRGDLLPAVQLTGWTLSIDNLLISYPGTHFGGIVPDFTFQ
ncbi:PE family protein [Mycobacterium sp. E796]|uniref:PE family protein n=1 Tax=Mycobacterium sp. E796 TaxID=1834151 RepID=UPI000800FDF0|nr:PE family protein [Mycobacterium sp. E796]OBI46063.1 hypothetical protein A5706_30505 [Mycobacterium sp. E796]